MSDSVTFLTYVITLQPQFFTGSNIRINDKQRCEEREVNNKHFEIYLRKCDEWIETDGGERRVGTVGG